MKRPEKIINQLKKLWNIPAAFSAVLSFVLIIVIECLSRHSLTGGVTFLIEQPFFFVINMSIIFACLAMTYFFPKRIFAQFMVSFVFLVAGIVNFVLLFTRTQPFEAVDVLILRTGISIVGVYLSLFEITLCMVAIVGAVVGIVFLFVKTPIVKVNMKSAVISSVAGIVLCTGLIVFSSASGMIPSCFSDKNEAYDTYGFSYCFGRSMFDRGISEPVDYSELTIDEILASIGSDKTVKPENTPNIIMVQLESFTDPAYFCNIEFEKDPIPTFTQLKKECSTGHLFVPSVGSGTANTEFEVLTGMCLDYFGTGEYPFKTILKTRNCETVCYDLKELGYTAHALHNHTGTFYDRNIVYKNLGFDTFTPIEYMNYYEVNPLGWAKDSVLVSEIEKALDSTKGSDLVFAVSVQGHGKYPSEPVDGENLISVSGIDNEALKHQFEYYAYQLSETDDFISSLIQSLLERDESSVLVLYGDHQPSIDYDVSDIITEDKHVTDYVIWSSFQMKKQDVDMESYQLSAYVMSRLGMNNGIITKLHQNYSENNDYSRALELLEYDMLYGDLIAYGREEGYTSPQMKMGIDTIKIKKVNEINGITYIIGKGFTAASKIYVNDRSRDTVFVSDGVLIAEGVSLAEGDILSVHQISGDFVDLGSTDDYVYGNTEQ